ncbi:hypothetical protein LTR08_001498 [Meristemomyces frigidus]|nr:hypothetical protein LTR08_001498 [Meristemomyces frigidus]
MDFDTSGDESPYADIPTRPMRVKVLYSFDQENKTNCLARFPNTLQIPAVAIDESSQVGVIELRQCLQSVVSASPELLSRLPDGDFTIYAYDYSEYETPLVGQGMLSVVLTAAAPSSDSEKTMITGRICKNIPALFSNGVKETLEVKLRLVPVSRPVQNEFSRSMDNARGVSPATSAGFDPNAWNASINQVRPHQHTNDYFNFESGPSASQSDMALVDDLFGLGTASGGGGNGQMLGSVGMAQTPTDPAFGFNPAFSHSAPGSRANSPMRSLDSSVRNDQMRHQSYSVDAQDFPDQSRPDSRASVRSEVRPPRHQRQASTQSMQHQTSLHQADTHYNEDGQARKRVKVTQADWRGRSSFGAKSGDLRVTAATAHSMQMHRPVATRPGAAGADLEPPPRVPTPVPQVNPMLRQQQGRKCVPARSFLRQASLATVGSDFMSDADHFSDALMSSPEEDSPNNSIAEGTPLDIPSSPPVFHSIFQGQPSSPALPTLPVPRMVDSGYMSERGFNSSGVLNNQEEDDENRSPDAQDLEVAAQYSARTQQSQAVIGHEENEFGVHAYPSHIPQSGMDVELEVSSDRHQLPHKVLLNMPPARYNQERPGYVNTDEDPYAELFEDTGDLVTF